MLTLSALHILCIDTRGRYIKWASAVEVAEYLCRDPRTVGAALSAMTRLEKPLVAIQRAKRSRGSVEQLKDIPSLYQPTAAARGLLK